MATQAVRRAQARSRLIEAAAQLIAEGGFARASCASVGARAGMSRGATNFHFGSKAELLEVVVRVKARQWSQALMQAQDEGLDGQWRAWLEIPDGSRLVAMFAFEALGPSPGLYPVVQDLRRQLVSYVAGRLGNLDDGGAVPIDRRVTAEVVVGCLLGLVMLVASDEDREVVEGAHGEFRALLAGVGAMPAAVSGKCVGG